ncbi:hypothetical protein GCM10009678_53340 [Actinomadura kijaniata]|uniref:Uncharacterized protein n=1 Tax=Actinomadura namibiensis TaxID=182080 RepID=A0A7W3LRS9_ACTNM|nr:hypothetical protein [Actinomadura namibiensis]MBA8953103.1 hypothetical protein [Actinomadura namibiensis]
MESLHGDEDRPVCAVAGSRHVSPTGASSAVLGVKQAKTRQDPELFAAHGILAAAHSSAVTDHGGDLPGHLASH